MTGGFRMLHRRANNPSGEHINFSGHGWLEVALELFTIGLFFGGIVTAIFFPIVGIPMVLSLAVGYFVIKAISKYINRTPGI